MRFSNNQRVTVIDGDDKGKTGVVVRLRRCDNGAWVCLDTEPAFPNFPADDDRHCDVMLYPEQVEALKAGA
jgi:hypothetical protein